jgi:hypothetical protein
MEVEAGGDHVAVVVEILVFDVLIYRLNILQPNVSICTVDRDSVAEEQLETSTSMEAESILRVIEIARPFDRGVVPPAAAEQKGGQSGMAQRVNQRGDLHRVGMDTRPGRILSPIIGSPFEGQIFKRVEPDLATAEPSRLPF